jgi:rRNA pseudouridine-1189 N-methylase Emg1 (Nep1/Mra1 family)
LEWTHAATCALIVRLFARVKDVKKYIVVRKVLVIVARAIRRFAGNVLRFAGVMDMYLYGCKIALKNTALIAPMKFSLISLAHALNATKSHVTLAYI